MSLCLCLSLCLAFFFCFSGFLCRILGLGFWVLGWWFTLRFILFFGCGGGICVDREVSGAGTVVGAAFGKLDHSSHGHYTRHGYESGQRPVEQCADAG
jgi:hypothetical protein